ncbi:FMN-binding protein [uncultured Jatrophihabitans sp.]|uniref:FMN-binding protein n=1 Tax=uncultured Jatrophihabitans sp. TaxID=1610747 RepID=UPI0035C99D4F
MKRLILSVTGTIAGVIALLSFKTQAHPLANAAPLPSAALGEQSTAPATTTPTTQTPTTAPTSSAAPTTRTYLGSSITTRYGVIQVKITVRDKKITDVSFAQLTAFDGRSEQINSHAAPQLLQETLSAQSAKIDTVSGASYTSDGYRQSLQSALDRAGI